MAWGKRYHVVPDKQGRHQEMQGHMAEVPKQSEAGLSMTLLGGKGGFKIQIQRIMQATGRQRLLSLCFMPILAVQMLNS